MLVPPCIILLSMQGNIAQQQDAIFHGPRRSIFDLSTDILMINLDQIQTKYHASSALMVCLIWRKFVVLAIGRLAEG